MATPRIGCDDAEPLLYRYRPIHAEMGPGPRMRSSGAGKVAARDGAAPDF